MWLRQWFSIIQRIEMLYYSRPTLVKARKWLRGWSVQSGVDDQIHLKSKHIIDCGVGYKPVFLNWV